MAQQSTEEQDSQMAAIDRAILTAQASADIAKHTLGSSSAPVGAPPESQQAHQQRLASLLHFRADRASDIPKSDIAEHPINRCLQTASAASQKPMPAQHVALGILRYDKPIEWM